MYYQLLKHLSDPSLTVSSIKRIQLNLDFRLLPWRAWRQEVVVPIPKPEKDRSDPNNYRPIALTSCLCNTMERMVNNRLVYYLESNNVITNLQSGFRKERSTVHPLIRLETWVREGLINRECVVAIFL